MSRIPGLKLRVVQADGQDVQPVEVDEFRIGVGETYDVIVEPQGGPRLHDPCRVDRPARCGARHAGAARGHGRRRSRSCDRRRS